MDSGPFGDRQHQPGVAGPLKALRDLMNSEETPEQNSPLCAKCGCTDRERIKNSSDLFLGGPSPEAPSCTTIASLKG